MHLCLQHTLAFLGTFLPCPLFVFNGFMHRFHRRLASHSWTGPRMSLFSRVTLGRSSLIPPCLLPLSFAIRFLLSLSPTCFHSFYVYLAFRANDDNGSRSGGVSHDTLVFGFQRRLINFGSAWLVSGWARFGFSLTKPGRFVCIGRSRDPAMHCAGYEF